jgi:hypothetical protein
MNKKENSLEFCITRTLRQSYNYKEHSDVRKGGGLEKEIISLTRPVGDSKKGRWRRSPLPSTSSFHFLRQKEIKSKLILLRLDFKKFEIQYSLTALLAATSSIL